MCTGGVYSAVLSARGAHITESPVMSHIHQAVIMCVVAYRWVYTLVYTLRLYTFPLYTDEPSYLSKALFTTSTHINYTEHKDVLAIIVSTAKNRRKTIAISGKTSLVFTCLSAKS